MQNKKPVSASRCEHVEMIFSRHINGNRRLFGGQLTQWIDMVGAVVARRHSEREVITATIDSLQFHAAVPLNSTVVLVGSITYVGHTSMEVKVETFVEMLDSRRELVNCAYLVFVALDESQHPVAVPGLLMETPEELEEYARGEKRQNLRKLRRSEGF